MAESEPPDDDAEKHATALAIIDPAPATMVVPAMIADLGEAAALRFIDFFTANIRNPNTRAAYAVAVRGFFRWLETARRPRARRDPHAPRLGLRRGADPHATRRRRSSSTWRRSACCSTG